MQEKIENLTNCWAITVQLSGINSIRLSRESSKCIISNCPVIVQINLLSRLSPSASIRVCDNFFAESVLNFALSRFKLTISPSLLPFSDPEKKQFADENITCAPFRFDSATISSRFAHVMIRI